MSRYGGCATRLFEDHQEHIREISLISQRRNGVNDKYLGSVSRYGANTDNPLLNLHRCSMILLDSPASRLRAIDIRSTYLDPTWIYALLNCGGLKKLHLHSNKVMVIPRGREELFLQVCGRIESLLLSAVRFSSWIYEDDPEAQHHVDLTTLRHLAIGSVSVGTRQNARVVGHFFVREAVNLETLRYCGRYASWRRPTMKHYETLLAGAGCSLLHTLDLSAVKMLDALLADMIRRLQGSTAWKRSYLPSPSTPQRQVTPPTTRSARMPGGDPVKHSRYSRLTMQQRAPAGAPPSPPTVLVSAGWSLAACACLTC